MSDEMERLLRLTTRGGIDECWPWKGSLNRYGYGRGVRIDGTQVIAHRASYQLLVGPIPDGMVIDHLCRNRACVNPAHMEPVTTTVNWERGEAPTVVNAKKTHCVNSHEFTEANTYRRCDGRRVCRACLRLRTARAATPAPTTADPS